MPMLFSWDERKRVANIRNHGFDFRDAVAVFEGSTFTFEDDRFSYDEQRFVTLGFVGGLVVSIVHAETRTDIRIISFSQGDAT